MDCGDLRGTPRRPVLVRIGDAEATRIELARLVMHVALRDVRPEASDVECERIALRFAVDHPGREREADAAAHREACHHAAGRPVVRHPGHRAHERVAVWRERERPVDDAPDACGVQGREAPESLFEGARQALEVRRQQFVVAVLPGRAGDRPRRARRLVDPQQDPLALLAHVELSVEIDDAGDLPVEPGEFRQVLGDQVVVLHRDQRQVDADEMAALASPQAASIHDMLGLDGPLVRHDEPGAASRARQLDHPGVAVDLGATLAGRPGIGVRGARRIQMPFHRIEDRPIDAARVHDRAALADLLRADQPGIESQCLVSRDVGLQQVPALLRRGHVDPAREVQADVLAGRALQFLIEADRGQVVEDAASDDAAADHDGLGMAFHGVNSLPGNCIPHCILRKVPDRRGPGRSGA